MSSTLASAGPQAPPLGLHEELSDVEREGAKNGCVCGPKFLRLRSDHGELVRPRGGSVNVCAYCATLAAVENCEMLSLDAMAGDPPTALLVLGTRTATVDMAGFYVGLEQVMRAIRRQWPAAEYASLVEFTTGYGPRSGGLRRPHWNLLLKGVPADVTDRLHAIAAPVWCRHVDAEPAVQHATPIYAAGGLMKYLALHFQKASQQPPAGFTGQRFNCSRGYFTGCTRAIARKRAREALALKREVWKAGQVLDDAYEIELAAHLAHRRNLATRWVLASDNGARLSPALVPKTSLIERLRAHNAASLGGSAAQDAHRAGEAFRVARA